MIWFEIPLLQAGWLQIERVQANDVQRLPGLRLRTAWGSWLRQMALGWPDLAAQLASGEVVLTEGAPEQLQAFLACFEPPAQRMPSLAVR